jgi:hypothetical protein
VRYHSLMNRVRELFMSPGQNPNSTAIIVIVGGDEGVFFRSTDLRWLIERIRGSNLSEVFLGVIDSSGEFVQASG